MVHVSSHVTSPYLNTVVGKDISLLTNDVLCVWLETGQICNVVHQRQKREEKSCRHSSAVEQQQRNENAKERDNTIIILIKCVHFLLTPSLV